MVDFLWKRFKKEKEGWGGGGAVDFAGRQYLRRIAQTLPKFPPELLQNGGRTRQLLPPPTIVGRFHGCGQRCSSPRQVLPRHRACPSAPADRTM